MLRVPGVVVKTKVAEDWLAVDVLTMGIGVVGVGHKYDPLSMVPFVPHTAMKQLPSPSVVL